MKKITIILILVVFISIGCSNETEVNTLNNELMEQISEKETMIKSMQVEINEKDSKIKDLETKIQSLKKEENISINEMLSDEDLIPYYDKSKKLYGYKDTNDNILISPTFHYARNFSEGLAAVHKNYNWGFINKNGDIVIDYQFKSVESFSDGVANVQKGEQRGFIDKTGVMILEINASESFSEGLLRINYGDYFNGKWGFLNKSGELVIDAQYEMSLDFSEGLVAVKKDGKWGFIDKDGKTAIDFKFDYACSFSEDIAAVNILGEWGYIYKTGVMVIQPQFDTGNDFRNGKAIVRIGGRNGYINKNGQATWTENETYNEGILLPIDETDKNDSFKNFKIEMLNAIKEKDIDFLKAHINENIKFSFGGGYGMEDFIKEWKLNENPETSELWTTLEQVLEMGSKVYGNEDSMHVWTPYVFTEFPDSYDPFEYSVCIDKNVNVYSKPSLDSYIITQLNYNIIKPIDDYRIEIYSDGLMWSKIQLPSGERGYVDSKYIRSPIDYRASFTLEDGTWKMVCFIAGD